MKTKVLKAILAFGLSLGMVGGTLYTAGGTLTVSAEESDVRAEDRLWDLTASSMVERPQLEGQTGEFDGIMIDATAGKFAPCDNDTQINAGTVLTVPVADNTDGATLTIRLSGGPAAVAVNGQEYASENLAVTIPLEASEEETTCTVTFTAQAYIASIELVYNEPAEEYPGVPENVQAVDAAYAFDSADNLLDENGNVAANATLEGARGTFGDMKVDAVSGKFAVQPANGRVQINAGTTLYIPAAYDGAGAELLIAGTKDGSTPAGIEVNGEARTTNERIALDMSDASAYPQYIAVRFTEQAYVTGISLNYASDSDYPDPVVEAKDKVWDFTASSAVARPDLQGAEGEYDGIQIDASTGKFSPRDTDTQVNAGTTLYIPVAPDENGASITVSGNNYNNLTLTMDGEPVAVGAETALPSVETASYVALEFSSADGTGSCYLYNIAVDYMSDSEVNVSSVTVGAGEGYDYNSIQAALDANESGSSNPLVIMIAALDKDGGEVIIEESYYSSNTFGPDGTFQPQDEYDLGTDQCGTVLLTANATGFSAEGITFQNSYNVADHTGEGGQTPAVAFGSAADRVYLKDCRFIGRQDTLYLHGAGSRVQVENCYIEGTVDFIFGDADAYFTGCELHMAAFAGRDTGYFTAANTKKGNVGFVFNDCTLTVDESYNVDDSTVSLGRPWQTECYTETARDEDGNSYMTVYEPDRKNPSYGSTSSAVTFIECKMDSLIQDSRWNVWTRKDANGVTQDVTFHEDVRFAEINSKDAAGNYLNPEDYKDSIVLGTMTVTDDAKGELDKLLAQMGFGEEIGEWNPSLPGEEPGIEEPENPGEEPGTGTEEPGTTPGTDDPTNPGQNPGTGDPTNPGQNTGAGTGNENNSGNTGNNGTVNNNGSAQNAAANADVVQTGDTTNVAPYVVALLASVVILLGAVLAIRMRRK